MQEIEELERPIDGYVDVLDDGLRMGAPDAVER